MSSFDSAPKRRKISLTMILGGILIVLSAVTFLVFYQKDLKPRITAEQEAVQKSYTFTFLCKVQEPLTGLFQEWLLGKSGKNAWVYMAGCYVESPSDIEIISNGVKNLLPEPQPGLHIIVIADSAPVSIFDWEKEFREAGYTLGDPNVVPPQKLTFYPFSTESMRLYLLYLLPENLRPDAKFKVLCREAIDMRSEDPREWRPYYLCSSN